MQIYIYIKEFCVHKYNQLLYCHVPAKPLSAQSQPPEKRSVGDKYPMAGKMGKGRLALFIAVGFIKFCF